MVGLCSLFCFLFFHGAPQRDDSLLIVFWNLENFFDWKKDSLMNNGSEGEFTSRGVRHWTREKFKRKSRAVAKSFLWLADEEGRMPDVIGVAEIENRFVLERLVRDTPLSRAGYDIVHYDSPDPRGIDVALLYRKRSLKLLESRPLRVEGNTRDILLACFRCENSDTLAFLVNHHPSKYGGGSPERRKAALRRLKEATDSLVQKGMDAIVAMGDFNDTPESTVEYSERMVNLAAPLARRGEGTIKYSGKWEMIDMFFISPAVAERNPGVTMRVARIPFLTVRDNAHSGEKPLRTYSGPRYAGGVSDHCPITLMIQ